MPFVKSVDVEFLQKYAEASFSDIKTGQPKRDYFDFTVSVRPNVAFLECKTHAFIKSRQGNNDNRKWYK